MSTVSYKNYYIPAFVLAFIFCGAIVGENVSISLVVSALGSSILSKLYLVNGVLLYGLPLFFLGKIDRVDRGNFLSKQLLVISGALALILIILTFISYHNLGYKNIILFLLYPISYLSKTILFLTFWTLANDIYATSEAKKTFPIIAAWGMAGGLIGACGARLIVNSFATESIIILWGLSYIAAWHYSEKARESFKERLRFREDLPTKGNDILSDAGDIITIRIVRLMGLLYFIIFIAVFSFDFLFWEVCHRKFGTSESLVSFQFTFYLFHACITILGLLLILPSLIRKYGFTKLFYCLPVVLLLGSSILLPISINSKLNVFFTVFVIIQFFRYVIFENTFSPIYQMFFAAIEKEKRGRAKTLLEGFVKPAAIVSSGILLMLLGHNTVLILTLLVFCSALTIVIIVFLRKTYSQTLIPEVMPLTEPGQIIESISQYDDKKITALIDEYSLSEDVDMRIISVRLLSANGSVAALEKIREIFNKDESARVKEIIAKSLALFYWYQTREFVEILLEDPNPRIRANTLMSINRMNCHWKRYMKEKIHSLLFDSHLRVQVEAAKYLWNNSDQVDRDAVLMFHRSLVTSKWTDRKSAGMYLAGELQVKGWQQLLIDNMDDESVQVFRKCAEVILQSSNADLKLDALRKIEKYSRDRIAITGEILKKTGIFSWETINGYLPECTNRRMMYEMIHCLRIESDQIRSSGRMTYMSEKVSESIYKWVLQELEVIYHDSFVRVIIGDNSTGNELCAILDTALRENHLRVCEWAINAMVLLDRSGMFRWKHTDIDIKEKSQRMDLVEILESASSDKIGSLVLPFLKNETWGTIGRIGKNYFHFDYGNEHLHIEYFLQSDNRWVVLCALRTLLYYSVESFDKKHVREILQMLTQDSNKHVATAGRDLLEKMTNEERLKSDAFILLEKVLFFKKTQLFRNVSAEKLMRLAEISQYAVFEHETVISVQGEVSDHLIIVKNGCLKVVKSDGQTKSEISRINPGETYGEIGLFTQSPRSASAVTDGSCELFIIKRGPFKKLLMEVPEIAFNLLETMSERMKKNADDLVELKKQSE